MNKNVILDGVEMLLTGLDGGIEKEEAVCLILNIIAPFPDPVAVEILVKAKRLHNSEVIEDE